jgi:hypothetical protein
MVHDNLKLDVIAFIVEWIKISCNNLHLGHLNMYLCHIYGTMYCKEATWILKPIHDLKQISTLWSFEFIIINGQLISQL